MDKTVDVRIKELEEKIELVDVKIEHTNSRIDTLSCYVGNDAEIDELVERCNELEIKKSRLTEELEKCKELKEVMSLMTKEEIKEKIKSLQDKKEELSNSDNFEDEKIASQLKHIEETKTYLESELNIRNKKTGR